MKVQITPYTEERYKDLLKMIAGFNSKSGDRADIKTRQKKALQLMQAVQLKALELKNIRDFDSSSVNIKFSDGKKALKRMYELREDIFPLQAQFVSHKDAFEELGRLRHCLNHMIYYIEDAKAKGLDKKKSGRRYDDSRNEFFETVIQVYEAARGIKLQDRADMKTVEARKIKTEFYKFLKLAYFYDKKVLDLEVGSLEKAVERYLKAGRPERDTVSDIITPEI